jgi:hypothetical protein
VARWDLLHLVVTIIEAVVHRHEPIWMQTRQSLGLLQRLLELVEVTLLLRSHENAKGVDRSGVQLIHDVISKREGLFHLGRKFIGHLAAVLCAGARSLISSAAARAAVWAA